MGDLFNDTAESSKSLTFDVELFLIPIPFRPN